jgi:ATP-dependent helicase/nuclease subunit B
MNHALHCYTIPAGKAFINALAGWLMAEYGQNAVLMSKTLVLLPNRRACRSLRNALLEISGGTPLLLPRIQPIGDADEEFAAAHYHEDSAPPAAVSPLCRQLLLTRLVHSFEARKFANSKNRSYNIEQAAKLARQLASLLDEATREGLDMSSIAALVDKESDMAEHWQQTLEFLDIVSRQWPAILAEEGLLDVVEQRNRVLAATAAHWQKQPPAHPVIAAGSTGSQPATAKLLATIATLPQGKVVLPALDCAMADADWDILDETHPQYSLKQLLDKLGVKRTSITMLDVPSIPASAPEARITCLRTIFQPPAATAGWSQSKPPLAEGLRGIRLLTAETQADEARMIAIALREALETPAKTAALVTPDRNLARMVASQMQRFGIALDDSAGMPLRDTPPACFLRLIAQMAASQCAPVPLLAMLRHPLAAAGIEPSLCRKLSRDMETTRLLRGIRHTPGLDALCNGATEYKQLHALLENIRANGKVFLRFFERKNTARLHDMLETHIAFAEWLASTADKRGDERLWSGEAGNNLAAFLAQLLEHADRLEPIDTFNYPGLLDALLAEQAHRPRHGLHPRLHVLGPMEARLQHFDLMILGGLNERTWPATPEADPWMSRPMRRKFGLDTPEYAIGIAAHDVFQFCCAKEVILSRAEKVEGAPTVPSRWLVRLKTLTEGLDKSLSESLSADSYYTQCKQFLDQPLSLPPLQPPAPKPPLAARPRQMRITAIDRWLRDPYAIYAQYILKLAVLPPIDEEPGAADFGTLVHDALEQFTKRHPQSLPDNALQSLIECGKSAFSGYIDRPAVHCLWWPRFENVAQWVIDQEKLRRGGIAQVFAECKGNWEFAVDGKPFTLTTSIDRIEMRKDGSAAVIDYKTGNVLERKHFDRGIANQLPLESLVLLNGTLEPAVSPLPNAIAATEYWKLGSSAEQCEIDDFHRHCKKTGIDSWLAETRERLESLVRRFDNAAEPYAAQQNPSLTLTYNDYEHLTRKKEWEAA